MTALNMAALLAKARQNREAKEAAAQKLPEGYIQDPYKASSSSAKPVPVLPNLPQPAPAPAPPSTPAQQMTIAERIALIRANAAAKSAPPTPTAAEVVEILDSLETEEEELTSSAGVTTGMHGEAITYNPQQQEAITTATAGKSFVLIGAAGTGKTTCSQGSISAIIGNPELGITPLQAEGHSYLPNGTPGVVIVAYTRRAVNNIRKVQSEEMKNNCITVHKLLEYRPEYYEITDPETFETKRTMRFEPNRNAGNPLPTSIHTIIVEEASMLSLDLFSEITAALTHKVQWIFIGDIQQLPPVFGAAVLGYKMLELPVIELTEVYRQALESPIIRLAHRVLSGKPIPAEEYIEWKEPNALTIHPWKKKLHPDVATLTLAAFFKAAIDAEEYDPEEDMILIPFNKGCGTIEINKHIGNYLARKREAITYEIMAGFTKHYFSIGDKVLYDKEDAEIIDIQVNATYNGARVQPSSTSLDYWGHNPNLANESGYDNSLVDLDADIDFLLEATEAAEDRVTQASHTITVRLYDTANEVELSKAAEVNALLHSYALTIHKSQGSEFRKVFFLLHQSHATMLSRELLYTGITRAREELYIICEPESMAKGIKSQRIKGNTLAEKAEFFKGKLTQ